MHTLFRLCNPENLRELTLGFYDDQYEYIKTFYSAIGVARQLTKFTFDMTLRPMKDPSSLYEIIRFVSDTLRYVQTLTILCRLADNIILDEDKFRHYLSFVYSVNEFRLFIEMNNLSQTTFDPSAYTYPFWTEKNIHVNIYRINDEEIRHVRIYTSTFFDKKSL